MSSLLTSFCGRLRPCRLLGNCPAASSTGAVNFLSGKIRSSAGKLETGRALDYFESGANPFRGELDRGHVGLAGHSAGGVAVSRLGQEDPRVSAIVSWDRAKSSPMPAGLRRSKKFKSK